MTSREGSNVDYSGGIILIASAAAMFVKVLIDAIRMAVDMPRWLPPLLALSGGILLVLVLFVANAVPLTPQSSAQAVLGGLLAGGMAIGVTEVGVRSQAATTRRRG